ncbi:MAG: hypothetical protein FRX49_11627 [Trebouxia sp. A1-2]|nr:MAG: hypothetical protein FRX49_11627 [Trebouxia sp. A1-2]
MLMLVARFGLPLLRPQFSLELAEALNLVASVLHEHSSNPFQDEAKSHEKHVVERQWIDQVTGKEAQEEELKMQVRLDSLSAPHRTGSISNTCRRQLQK